jgi:hypothetical protein
MNDDRGSETREVVCGLMVLPKKTGAAESQLAGPQGDISGLLLSAYRMQLFRLFHRGNKKETEDMGFCYVLFTRGVSSVVHNRHLALAPYLPAPTDPRKADGFLCHALVHAIREILVEDLTQDII